MKTLKLACPGYVNSRTRVLHSHQIVRIIKSLLLILHKGHASLNMYVVIILKQLLRMIFMRINAVVNLNPLVGSKLVKNNRRAVKSLTCGLLTRYLRKIGCYFCYFSLLLKVNLAVGLFVQSSWSQKTYP